MQRDDKENAMTTRRNKNRGYQQLIVWQDATEYYRLTCETFCGWSYEFKRVSSQQFSCVDSVHRNIAEGYCRRSIKEYIQFLYISLSSLGESVSALQVYAGSPKISELQFEQLDALAYKVENGMLKLVEKLEEKRDRGEWQDHLVLKESNDVYSTAEPPSSITY
jgi:four helix bundle protein